MTANSDDTAPIPFNRPAFVSGQTDYLAEALAAQKIGPGGRFSRACQDWLGARFDTRLALPSGSCTAALEIAAILAGLGPGDEVIMPSFGYPSTANAVVRTGAVPVFVDVEPRTMNIDPEAAEAAVTPKTRAIVPIHYGGVPADMDLLQALCDRHGLILIEDAANAFLAEHRGRHCGTLGALGCFSFHETKLVHCGQGGALLVNRAEYLDRAEVVLEKGTDRRQFLRGETDRYTWQDIGSSYALDDIRAAFLLAQFEQAEAIVAERVATWNRYRAALAGLADTGAIALPEPPADCRINGMIFWLKLGSEDQRDRLTAALAAEGIHAVFHYVPLHSSTAGRRFGRFHGADRVTSDGAGRLLRLPMYHGLEGTERIAGVIAEFCQTGG